MRDARPNLMLSYRCVMSWAMSYLDCSTGRGFRNRPTKHAYRTVGHLSGTLLLRGYERAERVGHAMTCRGYHGRFHALTHFQTRVGDVAFFVLLAGLSISLTALDWCYARR